MFVDLSIVIFFLAIILSVGIYMGSGTKTMREYALAERKYPTSAIIASLAATLIGHENVMGLVEKIHASGVIFSVASLGYFISLAIISFVFVPKIFEFQGIISAGDLMEKFYGRAARILTGICGVFYSIGFLSVQISGVGMLFAYFFHSSYEVGVTFGCLVILSYSSFGGIRSVNATDVIQFIIFMTAISLVCNLGISKVGGYGALVRSVPNNYLLFFDRFNSEHLEVFLIFAVPFLDPALMQRILISNDEMQASRALNVTGIVMFFVMMSVVIMGLVTYALFPESPSETVFLRLIKDVVPIGMRGIVIAGLLAVIMSTADSYLNVASIYMVRDVLQPLINKPMSNKLELRMIRTSTLIVSAMAIIASVEMRGVFAILFNFLNFWGPVIVIPLLSGILGYKASKLAFWAGSMSGIISLILWSSLHLDKLTGFNGFIPAVLLNAVCFFSVRIFERKKHVIKHHAV